MAEQFPRPTGPGRRPCLIRWRILAISIMVAGAVGFALSLVLFDENLICLSSSTLVTMAGLALLVTARRRGWELAAPADPWSPSGQSAWSRPRMGGSVPRGLRAYRPAQAPFDPPPASAADYQAGHETPAGPLEGRLSAQVEAIFVSQGAQVTVETLRVDRSLLRIVAAGGQEHTALVLESPSPAEAADGRALLALLHTPAGRLSGLGYLVAAGGFSPAAYQWAAGRGQVRLVSADELDELGL